MSKTSNSGVTVDEDVMRFEIRDGIRRISCVVSHEALEAASGLIAPSTEALRRKSFDRFRTMINAAALVKLSALPAGFIGPIVLTSRDLRRVPPETGTPTFGTVRNLTPTAPLADHVPAPSTTSNAVVRGPVP